MEHDPIYRSTSRRSNSQFIPWRRTASLASAAAALTMSGIALGYHSFTETPTATQPTDSTAETVSSAPNGPEGSVSAPVPTISVAIADGGHPDIISAITSALTTRFPIAEAPIMGLALGPVVQAALPVFGPPEASPEPFVVPPNLLEPLAEPAPADQPADAEDVAATPAADEVASADVLAPVEINHGRLLVAAGSQIEVATVAADDAPPPADEVQSDPEPAAPMVAQPEPARAVTPAPKLVVTPEPRQPIVLPTPAKLERVLVPVPVPVPPSAARSDSEDGNNQNGSTPPRSQPAKNDKGKGNGNGNGNDSNHYD